VGRRHMVEVDYGRPLAAQPQTGHNRWHPGIEPVLAVEPGDTVVLQTLDAMDGQLTAASTAADVAASSVYRVHPMTGPVYIQGAEPGDMLAVRIDDIEPRSFAWTAIIPGSGFLRDVFTEPFLIRWALEEGYATSADLPGVRIAERSFPGVIGVAPSAAMLASVTEREADLAARGGAVNPPDPREAVPADPRLAAEGLRTIPPREHGGNLDVKQLIKGTTVLIPVFTEGALFSCGDMHFAQGDGEVCGTAIEMAATVHLSFALHKGEAARRRMRGVCYTRDAGDAARRAPAGGYFATTGICVDDTGRNESEDANLAARNALLAMIDYLAGDRGYTRQQAYALCSVAVNLRLSQLVDVPNFVASATLPLSIFSG
jgi:formamidase